MHSLQYKIHDFRYKVEYYKTRYKQRYYSNDRNPRVIQTKLKNQLLLSLRTQPHDKYFLKPGEFLALVPKKLDKNVNQIIEVDTSRYLKTQFLKQRALFKGYDDNALTEKSYSGFHLEQNKYGNISSYLSSVCLNTSCTEIPYTCKHKTTITRNPSSPYFNLSNSKSNSLKDIESNREHYLGTSSTSPLIDLNSITSDINKNQVANPSNTYLDRSIMAFSNEPFDFENEQVCPIGTSGNQQPIGSNMHIFNTRRRCSYNNSRSHKTKIQNSWKVVLNAISLSAAKVSVGLSPKTYHDFENLTPDFINAKSTENKMNLTSDKHNIDDPYNIKGCSDGLRYTIEHTRFMDGNIQKYPTISNSISHSHYYNESGFLSMYNYNSDNESL